jgi:hypothetical protein
MREILGIRTASVAGGTSASTPTTRPVKPPGISVKMWPGSLDSCSYARTTPACRSCSRCTSIAETGDAALERVRALRPDLVLLDIRLPDINGLDLLPLA